MQDPYEGFAGRYDLFYDQFGRPDVQEVEFFRQLFARQEVQRVLDCACGTGRHLYLFQSFGCQVIGSDLSPSMLAQARKNLAAHGLDIPLHQVDYRDLPRHFEQPLDAVVCLSSSILHMPDDQQVLRAFRSMRRVRRPGGILVLTQGITDRQWQEKPRFILAVNTSDFSRLFAIDYLGQGARYNILDLFHSAERNELKAWSVEYPRPSGPICTPCAFLYLAVQCLHRPAWGTLAPGWAGRGASHCKGDHRCRLCVHDRHLPYQPGHAQPRLARHLSALPGLTLS